MPRQKNDGRGRLGGRKKGVPNKATAPFKELIAEHWRQYEESGQFATDLQELDPSTRATLMEKYAQYIAPRMKSVDLDISHDITLTIEDQLRKLCGDPSE